MIMDLCVTKRSWDHRWGSSGDIISKTVKRDKTSTVRKLISSITMRLGYTLFQCLHFAATVVLMHGT